MAKKKSGSNCGVETGGEGAREFVLQVAMHCRCDGCMQKMRVIVRYLTLVPGVEVVDQSSAETTGEVRLLATLDPERLRQRLSRATCKKVQLLFLSKERSGGSKEEDAGPGLAAEAAAQALLPDIKQQLLGGSWDSAAGRYVVPSYYPGPPAAASGVESTGEVRLLATTDPERLQEHIQRATGKKVELLFPPKQRGDGSKEDARVSAAEAAEPALLPGMQLLGAARGQEEDARLAPAVLALLPGMQLLGDGSAAGSKEDDARLAKAELELLPDMQMLGDGSGGSYGAAYPWTSSSSTTYQATAAGASGVYGCPPLAPDPTMCHDYSFVLIAQLG